MPKDWDISDFRRTSRDLFQHHVFANISQLVKSSLITLSATTIPVVGWDSFDNLDEGEVSPTDLLTTYDYYAISKWLYEQLCDTNFLTMYLEGNENGPAIYIMCTDVKKDKIAETEEFQELGKRVCIKRALFGDWVFYSKTKYGAEVVSGCDDINEIFEQDVNNRLEQGEDCPYVEWTDDNCCGHASFKDYAEQVDHDNVKEETLYQAVKEVNEGDYPRPVYFVFENDQEVEIETKLDWEHLSHLMEDVGSYAITPRYFYVEDISSEFAREQGYDELAKQLYHMGY